MSLRRTLNCWRGWRKSTSPSWWVMMRQNQRAPKLQLSLMTKHINIRVATTTHGISPCCGNNDDPDPVLQCVIWGIEKLIDIFGSGMPCQPFSKIGSQLGSKDPRSRVAERAPQLEEKLLSFSTVTQIEFCLSMGLLPQVVGRINRWLPNTYILENVPALASQKNRKFFQKLLRKPLVLNMAMVSVGDLNKSVRRLVTWLNSELTT